MIIQLIDIPAPSRYMAAARFPAGDKKVWMWGLHDDGSITGVVLTSDGPVDCEIIAGFNGYMVRE